MSVKGQLHATRDSLMAGMRAIERGATRNEEALKLIRACLDLVEQLVRVSENVKAPDIETTLNVLNRAGAELDADEGSPPAATAAIRNAMARLESVRSEIAPTKPPPLTR